MKIKLFLVVTVLTVLGLGGTALASQPTKTDNTKEANVLFGDLKAWNDGNFYYSDSKSYAYWADLVRALGGQPAGESRPANMYTLFEMFGLPNDGNVYYFDSAVYAQFADLYNARLAGQNPVTTPSGAPTEIKKERPANAYTLFELYGLPDDGNYYYPGDAVYAFAHPGK